ncbi:MAG TPA: transcription termination factor Rho [Pseudonocardiaceae bacterium]|nr:transcription termination factor Rho [Pseudonocardiaceae bacterium]
MSNTDLLSSDSAKAVSTAASSESDSQGGASANGTAPRKRAGLSGMVLAELRELAGQLGLSGTAGMRKGDLIAAIKERQASGSTRANGRSAPAKGGQTELPVATASAPPAVEPAARTQARDTRSRDEHETRDTRDGGTRDGDDGGFSRNRRRRTASRPAGSPDGGQREGQRDSAQHTEDNQPARDDAQAQGDRRDQGRDQGTVSAPERDRTSPDRTGSRNDRPQGERGQGDRPGNRPSNNGPDDDDDRGGRRGRRFRDRRRGRGRGEGGDTRESSGPRMGGGGGDTEIREDDVLLPVGGILDVLDNYAFVRTSGYLAGPNDVYVSLSLVRRYGLRRGDAITGVVRQPRDGEQQRQKFNPLVRVDKINGLDPDQVKDRPEFTKLTPLYPNERLRLETEPHILTTRVIDLVMPVGKGQRALIVSPPKAGKTMVLQSIANAITTNNPECHLMVVLVDERPEEVTDMQRSVRGEVIASTFDRPPGDHTSVAELSIERAKRLVEMGHDVVVLLDSITRLGRAYNLAAPASGRILSGGVDSTALFPPKRFLGAARNIEDGGSLTIFATALVETGSTGDTVIFEEFKGTGNAELKLDRKIADKRVFPAVDVDQSSTRKEELLLPPDELAVTHKLRRVLHALDTQQAIDLLLVQLRKSRTNIEFLMQVAKTTPGGGDD